MTPSLRVGVIGLGSMGANHARVYDEIEGVDLVAVADVSRDRLSTTNAAAYDAYRRMLADERLDLVSVCVPTLLHHEVALAAIERGIAVLVEKPIAATLDEGRAIARAAKEAGVPLMVGHVERFNPAVIEAGRHLEAGLLGRVFQIHARRTGPFPQRVRDVGVVHDLAPHDIDVICFLLGSRPERVYAETLRGVATEHEDALCGVLHFPDGVTATLDVNWLTPVKVRRLSILGEKGLLEADYLSQQLAFYPRGAGDLPTSNTHVAEAFQPRPLPSGSASEPEHIRVDIQEPLRLELETFADAVRRRLPPPVSAEDGLAALEIASLLVESAESGRALDLSTRSAP